MYNTLFILTIARTADTAVEEYMRSSEYERGAILLKFIDININRIKINNFYSHTYLTI